MKVRHELLSRVKIGRKTLGFFLLAILLILFAGLSQGCVTMAGASRMRETQFQEEIEVLKLGEERGFAFDRHTGEIVTLAYSGQNGDGIAVISIVRTGRGHWAGFSYPIYVQEGQEFMIISMDGGKVLVVSFDEEQIRLRRLSR